MEYVFSNLNVGVLTTAPAAVYTVPNGSNVLLRSIVLVNKSGADATVSFTVAIPSKPTVYILPPTLTVRTGRKVEDATTIALPAGSVITASASANSAIDFILTGVIA